MLDHRQVVCHEHVGQAEAGLQILLDESLKGNCYTANQFAEAFEGKAGRGGERTIRDAADPLKVDPVAHVNNGCVGCSLCGEVAHAAEIGRAHV
mgnify:CR=1 FL=1